MKSTATRLVWLAGLAVLVAAAACVRTADRPSTDSSTALGAAGAGAPSSALATDGSLTVDIAASLQPALRALADSFAVREAIAVAFSSGSAGAADLLIVTADELRALPADSLVWTLAFAVRASDSVVVRAPTDSTGVLVFAVPVSATNTAYVERFVRYVLDDARGMLHSLGLMPLVRREVRGHGVPPSISAIVDTIVPFDTAARADSVPPA